MKLSILDWNVNFKNKFAFSTLTNLLNSQSFDVICLQEVSWALLTELKKIPEYTSTESANFLSYSDEEKDSRYIVTLTKFPIIKTEKIILSDEKLSSLQANLLYKRVYNQEQKFFAVKTTVRTDKNDLTILNTHLPCATGTKKRIALLEKLLAHKKETENTIICGDFNIMDSLALNLLSGWFRGFTFNDYKYNERVEVQALCEKYKYTNALKNHITCSATPIPRLQFDHILVPNNTQILATGTLSQKGSDHFPIYTSLNIL